jgi:hypothetical protein
MDHIADPADPMRATILNTVAGGPPTWTPAAGGGSTTHGRINGHLVLLPDATVLVCGGHNHYKWYDTAGGTTPSKRAEIYTPSGPEAGFRVVAEMTHPRMYHSAALLLPDGRVVIAGGADRNEGEPRPATWPTAGWPPRLQWTTGAYARNRKEREIYRPPYLFYPGTQPQITGVTPKQVPYGSTFVVTTPQAADITVVALMRPGASTHHTDSEQRYVPLTIASRTADSLTVTMLPQAQSATAPPGYYMLWIADTVSIDVGGTPRDRLRPCQRAEFVQIPGPPRPATSPCPLCVVATVTMVVALRDLRHELETATAVGRRFIRIINRLYYSFSPWLAAWLARHERARLATRDIIVRPGTAAVRGAARVTAPIPPVGARHAVLMLLLVLLAALGVALGPLAALALIAHAALQRHPRHRHGPRRGTAPQAPGCRDSAATDEGEGHAR